jgi:hypothetical protein
MNTKYILMSLPWINYPKLNIDYANLISSSLNAKETYLLSNHNNLTYENFNTTFSLVHVSELQSNYENPVLNTFTNYFSDENYYKFKFNLISILERWVRTYALSHNFFYLDRYSNLITNYWASFLINNKINFVVINSPHTPHDFAIYSLAKLMQIPILVLIPFFSPLNNLIRYIAASDVSWDNKINYDKGGILDPDLENVLTSYINNSLDYVHEKNEYSFKKESYPSTLISRIKKMSLFRLKKVIVSYFGLLYDKFKDYLLLDFVSRVEVANLEGDVFIYYPLHYQPEATTIPTGNNFSDQLEIIRLLSIILPKGIKLYVKEHPVYWKIKNNYNFNSYSPINEFRSKSFYKEIVSMENVSLISHNIDTTKLIKMAKGVVSVSGTVIFEALILDKPALQFGEHHYLQFPNSFNANESGELKNFLKIISSDKKYSTGLPRVKKILTDIQNNSIDNVELVDSGQVYSNTKINNKIIIIIEKLLRER